MNALFALLRWWSPSAPHLSNPDRLVRSGVLSPKPASKQ